MWNLFIALIFKPKRSQSMEEVEYRQILGVSRSPTREELLSARMKRIIQHNPQKYINASEEEKEYHKKMLSEAEKAYKFLLRFDGKFLKLFSYFKLNICLFSRLIIRRTEAENCAKNLKNNHHSYKKNAAMK